MNKIIKYMFFIGLISFMSSCNESEDLVTAEAQSGAFTSIAGSSGALLGNPDENGNVVFVVTNLDYTVDISSPNESQVASVSVFKSYGGEDVEITTSSTYPIEVDFTTLDEFLTGFTATSADVAIGQVLTVYSVMNMTDGRALEQASNVVSLTVQCLSNLAGTYSMSGQRDDGLSYGPYTYTITELSPGSYQGSRSGAWAPGRAFFTGSTGEARITFSDVCGELFVPSQQLNLGQYSNAVYGNGAGADVTGTVDATTGVITLVYNIEFSGTPSVYTEVLTPQ